MKLAGMKGFRTLSISICQKFAEVSRIAYGDMKGEKEAFVDMTAISKGRGNIQMNAKLTGGGSRVEKQ